MKYILRLCLCVRHVTPHAGVRIEIRWARISACSRTVTPHAGVRIEMSDVSEPYLSTLSPPTRGCELKFVLDDDLRAAIGHPPRGGAN